MRRIKIAAGDVIATATINDGVTADAVWKALPFSARASRWGKEYYFGIPVGVRDMDTKEVVNAGDLGFWEPGHAFCVFWGPTPASHGNEIRPASPVSVFGKLDGDVDVFDHLSGNVDFTVEKLG